MSLSFEDVYKGISASNTGSNQRWYDAYPDLQKSLVIMASFPPEILDIVAQGIVEIAERDCWAHQAINAVKSLGKEKVLALHKSKARRRFYDHNPQLHKAMNYIFVLSEGKRQYVCQKMKALIEYVFDYLKTCDEFKALPNADNIGELANTFVRKGSPATATFLEGVRKTFEGNHTTLPEKTLATSLRVDSSEIRISATD
jgi:hypothetical protein